MSIAIMLWCLFYSVRCRDDFITLVNSNCVHQNTVVGVLAAVGAVVVILAVAFSVVMIKQRGKKTAAKDEEFPKNDE